MMMMMMMMMMMIMMMMQMHDDDADAWWWCYGNDARTWTHHDETHDFVLLISTIIHTGVIPFDISK
jgi:hypothetical protein